MVNFKEIYHFFKVPEGVQHYPGGVQLFPGGGGGYNCLFPIETHITFDFPGGSGPPAPPPSLDPHLLKARNFFIWWYLSFYEQLKRAQLS